MLKNAYIKHSHITMNKMKEELGLEIIQESMVDKDINFDFVINSIQQVCESVLKVENRQIITTNDFKKYSSISIGSLRKYIKKYLNMNLTEYLKSLGYIMNGSGTGLNYTFDDGEKTTSRYEYEFSNFLRELGLQYNIDYLRDVKYRTFIDNYKGLLNCDYIINFNNDKLYVEIVGLIEGYKDYYYNDIEIKNSKSKEKYRNKLKLKEQMFKDNNLNYYIIFPEDLDIFEYKLEMEIKR